MIIIYLQKHNKKTYKFTIGVKRQTDGSWIRDVKYTLKSTDISRDARFEDVYATATFCQGTTSKSCVLLDWDNIPVDKHEFVAEAYVKRKPTIGLTKLYVGLTEPKRQPPHHRITAETIVTLDDVRQEMQQQQEEQDTQSESGEQMCNTSLFTPYQAGVKNRYFMARKKPRFDCKQTKWGLFFMVPNELLDDLDAMNCDVLEHCILQDKACQYFFQNNPTLVYEVVANGVIKLDSLTFTEFSDWLNSI